MGNFCDSGFAGFLESLCGAVVDFDRFTDGLVSPGVVVVFVCVGVLAFVLAVRQRERKIRERYGPWV